MLILIMGFTDLADGKISMGFDNIGGRISNNFQFIAAAFSQIFQGIAEKVYKPAPSYELQVSGARYVKDCVQKSIDKREPCLLVDLEIRNNGSESLILEIKGKTIVTKDGQQLERYGGLFNIKELSGECDSSTYFKMFPNARTVTGMCYPRVGKSDNPVLFLKVSVNGKPDEHSFDLSPYLP